MAVLAKVLRKPISSFPRKWESSLLNMLQSLWIPVFTGMTTFARASCLFAFCILIFNFSPAFAWKLPLEVSTISDDGKKVSNKLVVRIEAGATDSFDNIWDTQALVANSDPEAPALLRAYLKNDSEAREDLRQLWKDIRGTSPTGSSTTWDISVDSVPAGKSVVINWEVPPGAIKNGERLVLKDNNKPVQMDITQTSNYSYVAGEGETRTLTLTLSRPKSANNSVSSGGFGCGTIKPYNNDSTNGWSNAAAILLLLLPVFLLRFIRLTRVRLSI